jgi:hypothetical protein
MPSTTLPAVTPLVKRIVVEYFADRNRTSFMVTNCGCFG